MKKSDMQEMQQPQIDLGKTVVLILKMEVKFGNKALCSVKYLALLQVEMKMLLCLSLFYDPETGKF